MQTLTETEQEEVKLVLRTLEEVVAEAGADYVCPKRPLIPSEYGPGTGCHYVWENKPDCIVGRVLFKLGWTLDELRQIENMIAIRIPREEAELGSRLSIYSWEILSFAQQWQDLGHEWSKCLAYAKDYARNNYGIEI